MEENYIDLIDDLNESIFDEFNDTKYLFGYAYGGYVHLILFGDIILWHSEDDDRYFDEEKDEYEPMKPFIIRKFKEYRDMLNSIKI